MNNTLQVLSRLESASGPQTLTKDEAKALVSQVNYLEQVVATLLASIKKRKKLIDVQVPYRQQV